MIVEQRDYHVITGTERAREAVQTKASSCSRASRELLGAFTTDIGALSTYTTMWVRELRRAEARRAKLQADDAGRRSSRRSSR